METAYLSCPECGLLKQMPQAQLDKMDDYPECPDCNDGTTFEDEQEWNCDVCGDEVWRHEDNCIFWTGNDCEDGSGNDIAICKKCLEKKYRTLPAGRTETKVVEKIVEKPIEKIVYKYVDSKGESVEGPKDVSVGRSFGGATKFD